MIRKFAWGSGCAVSSLALIIILSPALPAQVATPSTQPQTQQQPQTPASQEPSEEIGMRKPKPKEYKKWSFNAGGGASLTNGTTRNFVRGGGGVGAAGVARNYSRYFGFRLDFQFDNLPLKASALQQAGASGANDHVYSLMLSPIINIPVSKNWGGYIIG